MTGPGGLFIPSDEYGPGFMVPRESAAQMIIRSLQAMALVSPQTDEDVKAVESLRQALLHLVPHLGEPPKAPPGQRPRPTHLRAG